MKKSDLIDEILKQDPHGAFYAKGTFIGNKDFVSAIGDWTYPFRRFVNCHIKVIGDTGGPSQATIKQYKYLWNKKALHSASKEELLELKEVTSKQNTFYKKMYEKYSNMNMVNFLGMFDCRNNK